MNVRKVVNFLVLRDAMNTRNMTSLGLVAVLVGVFVASGGKITAPPLDPQDSGAFGSIGYSPTDEVEFRGDVVDSEDIRYDSPDEAAVEAPAARTQEPVRRQVGAQPSARPSETARESERDANDRLSELELRLKNLDARMKENEIPNVQAPR